MKTKKTPVKAKDQIKKLELEVKRLRRLLRDSEYMAGPFFATKRRKLFHKRKCPWIAEIPDDRLIQFSSHVDAENQKFKPCKTCRA